MEAGDHWLVYATVDNGKLLDDDGVTAVHHRKSGNHY
jgi:flavin reductase (DIM6/NTAB) family NADH-FMN oxidoreductase RutF